MLVQQPGGLPGFMQQSAHRLRPVEVHRNKLFSSDSADPRMTAGETRRINNEVCSPACGTNNTPAVSFQKKMASLIICFASEGSVESISNGIRAFSHLFDRPLIT
jgi:hypothetical protein